MIFINRKYKDARALVRIMTFFVVGLGAINLLLFYLLTTAKNHYNLQLDIFKQQIGNWHRSDIGKSRLIQTDMTNGLTVDMTNGLTVGGGDFSNEMQLHIFTTLGPVMSQRHYWALLSWARLNHITKRQQVHIHIFTNLDTKWKESREEFVTFVQSLGCATEHKLNEDGLTNDSNRLPYMNYLFTQAMEVVPPVTSYASDRDNVVFAYLNADIFVTESLFHSIRSVYLQKPEKMLLVARRWNLDQEYMLSSLSKLTSPDFDEQSVYNAVYKHGDLFMDRAIDLFAFNRKLFGSDPLNTIPPFIMAAPYWDNWTLQYAGSQENCYAIDATKFVMIIHLNHNSHRFASHMSTYLVKNFKTAKGYIWPLTSTGSTFSLPYEMFGSMPNGHCPCISKR
jgi:hypothetical protein